MADPAARPATLLPPPLIYAAVLFVAWWLNTQWPWALELASQGQISAWVLIALGMAGFAWALSAIWHHRTTVNPYKAASTLVTDGPFRYSRNPIYVSDWLVYAGVTLWLRTLWPIVFVPLVWVLMRYFVIAYEEAHLQAKFGASYSDYCSRVRRWI
jgi:protein-S-isoprenylcysteine O-methyltransferase Ste14